jgi:hypothetical protein
VIWSLERRTSEIRSDLRAGPVVTFLIPTAVLPAGADALRLSERMPPDPEPLLEARFRVERAD